MEATKRVQIGIRTTQETAQKLKELADTMSVSVGDALSTLVDRHGHTDKHSVDLNFTEKEWTALTMLAAANQQTPASLLKNTLLASAKKDLLAAAENLGAPPVPHPSTPTKRKEAGGSEAPDEPTFLSKMLTGL